MQLFIRPIAIAVIRDAARLLLMECRDDVKKQTFYRPLGGEIEFGEHSSDTVRRELREEIGAELTNLKYLGALENRFIYNGKQGHEIVFVYDAAFCDPKMYATPEFDAREHDGSPFRAVWKAFDDFGASGPPLYPDGLMEMLCRLGV